MKIKQLLFLLCLVFSTVSYGQTCTSCTDPGNIIANNNNGTLTASSAQAYYWEVCQGNATISGSNTGQTVSVSCLSDYRIKVTRFVNGNCMESCEIVSCGGGTCPTSIYYLNEGGGGLCTTGLAILNGVSNVNYVNWTWALGGYSGTVPNAGTTTPIYYPSGNWTNYYIVICAQVVFNDGTVCSYTCESFLLDCGTGPGGPIKTPILYPNPANSGFYIQMEGGKTITTVDISNAYGSTVTSVASNFNDEIDLSTQDDGIYFVKITFADGTYTTEKLILKK